MPDVTVDLKDLEVLVKEFLDCKTNARAEIAVRSKHLAVNSQAVQRYIAEVEAETSKAYFNEELRFRELLKSLEDGKNVSASLTRFIVHARECQERNSAAQKPHR